ncbi:MAG: NAD(P)-dependent oxidoreductase [Alphaproteobacteria bacterium]|nr:NAD(P)-dependent oxidoreductase [Alphaproteobacteria bacterium]
MKTAIIGVGAMGIDIAGHVMRGEHAVTGFDVSAEQMTLAAEAGIATAGSIADAVAGAELALVVVATDAQSETVTREILASGASGLTIVILATNHMDTMRALATECAAKGIGFVDAPVVYGRLGAKEGNLVSLCGGAAEDIARIEPVLKCYSRAIHHVGPVGAGQLAKTCNNMMHWAACVTNYETLLLAKRYGVDAQRMREILLDCPAHNTTLKRWDTTRFTWHEKDMDIALDLAQSAGLALPLYGQVDQLVKRLGPDRVKELLYGAEAEYLGMKVTPLPPRDGGLG